MTPGREVETTVCEIRRNTRKKYSEDEKIRIVLECLQGGTGVPELRRRKGIHMNMHYKGSKEFLDMDGVSIVLMMPKYKSILLPLCGKFSQALKSFVPSGCRR